MQMQSAPSSLTLAGVLNEVNPICAQSGRKAAANEGKRSTSSSSMSRSVKRLQSNPNMNFSTQTVYQTQ